jgi:hypothetical protein
VTGLRAHGKNVHEPTSQRDGKETAKDHVHNLCKLKTVLIAVGGLKPSLSLNEQRNSQDPAFLAIICLVFSSLECTT